MPYNVLEIQEMNSDEISLHFNVEDFSTSNSSNMDELEKVLVEKKFSKVKFTLEEACPSKEKFLFIRFVTSFLSKTKTLTHFDLSGLRALPKKRTRPSVEATPDRIKRVDWNSAIERVSIQLFKELFCKPSHAYQSIILCDSYFNLGERTRLNDIYRASCRIGCIDLRNTHTPGKCFTSDQLYRLVDKNETMNSILVSYQALPKSLQALCAPSESFNLSENVEIIIESHRQDLLEQHIQSIEQSQSAEKPINLLLASPLSSLSNTETQLLAKAFNKDCALAKATLVPCDLALLAPVLADASINHLDLSKLGATEEVLSGLIQILSTNTHIHKLSIDYRLFLMPDFLNLIQAIQSNAQSGLKNEKGSAFIVFRYIELVDPENRLRFSGMDEMALRFSVLAELDIIQRSKERAELLTNIPVILDSLCLNYDLRDHLARQKLLVHPLSELYSIKEDWDIEMQRQKPLVYFRDSKVDAFILSPQYDTYHEVMNSAEGYLTRLIKTKESLWNEMCREITEEEMEFGVISEEIDMSDEEPEPINPVSFTAAPEAIKDLLLPVISPDLVLKYADIEQIEEDLQELKSHEVMNSAEGYLTRLIKTKESLWNEMCREITEEEMEFGVISEEIDMSDEEPEPINPVSFTAAPEAIKDLLLPVISPDLVLKYADIEQIEEDLQELKSDEGSRFCSENLVDKVISHLAQCNTKFLQAKAKDKYLPTCCQSFFGMNNTFAWQEKSLNLRTEALRYLKTELVYASHEEKIKILDYSLQIALFNEHRSNYILTGAFGNTATVNILQQLKEEVMVSFTY